MNILGKLSISLSKSTIATATSLIFLSYILSSVLGLLRNRILAQFFGDSSELGVFYLADKLPSFLFSTIVFTVLSASFIPLCVSLTKKGKSELNTFVSGSVVFFLFLYSLIILPILFFPNFFANLLSWNSLSKEYNNLLSSILIWDLVSQLFFILVSFFSSYLQSLKKFFVPALTPIIYNSGVIFGILLFSGPYGIYSTIIGMFIGNLISLFFIIVFLQRINFNFSFNFFKYLLNPYTKKLILIASPRFMGILLQRLYILLIGGLISFIYKNPAYLVIYEYANQLQSMPVQAFGNSLSQVLFPTFSELAEGEKNRLIAKTLNRYVLKLTYFIMPVICVFFILKIPIVRILYGGDKFSWLGTNLTSYTLAFFSISIWFQSLNTVFFRVFYSFKNSVTPTYSSFIALFLSFGLSVYFGLYLGYGLWSLALSFSIGSIVQTFFLYFFLYKKIGPVFIFSTKKYIKIFYSTLITGFILYLLMQFFDTYVFDTTRTLPLVLFTLTVVLIGFSSYFVFLDLVGVKILRKLIIRVIYILK